MALMGPLPSMSTCTCAHDTPELSAFTVLPVIGRNSGHLHAARDKLHWRLFVGLSA